MNRDEQIKVAKRIITVMLCILFGCYIAFIFGARWFTLVVPERLQGIDVYIREHFCLYFITTALVLFPQTVLFCSAVCGTWKLKNWLYGVLAGLVLLVAAARIFIPYNLNYETFEGNFKLMSMVSRLTDLILFVGAPLIIGKTAYKQKLEALCLYSLAGYLVYLGYNELSFVIKDLISMPNLFGRPMLNLIYLIDIYFALMAVYAYSNLINIRRYQAMGKAFPMGAGTKDLADKAKADKAAKKKAKKEKK